MLQEEKYTTERFTLRSDFTSNMIFFEKKHCQIFIDNYIQINLLLIKIVRKYDLFSDHKMFNQPFVVNISLEFNL